jgi:class 3 adenylate cyclase
MHPERVDALVLSNTTARYLVDDGYPIGASLATLDVVIDRVRALWGTTRLTSVVSPAHAEDIEHVRQSARRLRASATPATAAAQVRYMLESLDVRAALPSIHAPTLVLHTSRNPFIPVEHGRYLAEHIVGARFVEVPGRGIGFDDDKSTFVLEEIAEFLTGERPVAEVDRVLTTVMFTDIVSSTEQLSVEGDVAWRRLLDHHDDAASRVVREYRGRVVKQLGDGILATFDGPARAVRCAAALVDLAAKQGIVLRTGLHTGEIELRGTDITGIAVVIAQRVSALAAPSEILVSRTVADLTAGSGLEFDPRGEHQLKGVPGTWLTFAQHRLPKCLTRPLARVTSRASMTHLTAVPRSQNSARSGIMRSRNSVVASEEHRDAARCG